MDPLLQGWDLWRVGGRGLPCHDNWLSTCVPERWIVAGDAALPKRCEEADGRRERLVSHGAIYRKSRNGSQSTIVLLQLVQRWRSIRTGADIIRWGRPAGSVPCDTSLRYTRDPNPRCALWWKSS